MAEKRQALGRGLSALIPEAQPPIPNRETDRQLDVDIDLLAPNPRQPRTQFEERHLEELAASIRVHGVIQPILVRRSGTRFEIIAGERRWRAAQQAGLLRVPVVIRNVPDDQILQVALVENIQRENLNPIEEASAYRRLTDELRLTQDAIAAAVGKDRATVSNYMRLLKLPDEIQGDIAAGSLSMGHARALLALSDDAAQRRVAREVVSRGISVRETEAMIRREQSPAPLQPPVVTDPNTRAAEQQLRVALGTRVRIIRRGKGGRLEIDFGSEAELQRLFEALTSRG